MNWNWELFSSNLAQIGISNSSQKRYQGFQLYAKTSKRKPSQIINKLLRDKIVPINAETILLTSIRTANKSVLLDRSQLQVEIQL
jgi:hypothetical protein